VRVIIIIIHHLQVAGVAAAHQATCWAYGVSTGGVCITVAAERTMGFNFLH